MWDGFWMIGNPRSWRALPEDVQEIVSRNMNGAAMRQRADLEELNGVLESRLVELGMQFNTPDTAAIREKLSDSGFYSEWRNTYGEEAWDLLEQVTGPLV